MRKSIKRALISLAIISLILLSASSAGCIKLVQKNLDNSTEASIANPTQKFPASPSITDPVSESQQQAGFAEKADPILPAENYRTIRNLSEKNGEVSSRLLRESYSTRTPLYHLEFSPQYNATAIRVNVTRGPLVIGYKITNKFKDPQVSFTTITVRDYHTKEIIAMETPGHIPKDLLETMENHDETRLMVIPREGTFHINVYGNQCDVDLSVYSGDSLSTIGSSPGSATIQRNEPLDYDLG